MKKVAINFLVLSAMASPVFAQEINFCTILGQSGCEAVRVSVNPDQKSIIVFRGYAFNEKGKAAVSGKMLLEHEATGTLIPLNLKSVAAPELTAKLWKGGRTTPIVSSEWAKGVEALVYTNSLLEGEYRIKQVTLRYEGETTDQTIDLSPQNGGKFKVELSSSGVHGLALLDKNGSVVTNFKIKPRVGRWDLVGYPALRDGEYTISANVGAINRTKPFRLQRPIKKLSASLPLAEGFPGAAVRLQSIDTLRSVGIDGLHELINDSPEKIIVNGEEVASNAKFSSSFKSGIASIILNDQESNVGTKKINLFNLQPDGNNIEIEMNRWSVVDRIIVEASKSTAAIKVDDVSIQAKIKGSAQNTCSGLKVYKENERLYETDGLICSIYWEDRAGIEENKYLPASLRGAPKNLGENRVKYRPGVILTNPLTKETKFYPSIEPSQELVITGTEPEVIELGFSPSKTYTSLYQAMNMPENQKLVKVNGGKGEQLAGNIYINGRYGPIRTQIKVDQNNREFYSSLKSAGYAITAGIPNAFERKAVTIESWYDRAPEYKSTMSFDLVGVPVGVRVFPDRDFVSHNQSDTIITGIVAESIGNKLQYDPVKNGVWEVEIVDVETNEKLGPRVRIDESGKFSINLGILAKGQRRAKAIAYLVKDTETTELMTTSVTDFYIVTHRGEAPIAKLNVRTDAAAVPFIALISAVIDDLELAKNVERYTWEVSKDGGATWEIVKDEKGREFTRQTISPRFTEPADYRVRVTSKNKYSGQTYTSEPVPIIAYQSGTFTLNGPSAAAIDTEIQITSQTMGFDNPVYRWKFTAGSETAEVVDSYEKPSFVFKPKKAGNYAVSLSVKDAAAPDAPQHWVTKNYAVRAVNPLAARATIDGPREVEIGKTYPFKAKINDVVSAVVSKNYTVKGAWLMPDGSRVEGDHIDYTIAPGQTAITYLTWVENQPSVTTATVFPINSWQYVWPQWNVVLKVQENSVPARISYAVQPVNSTLKNLRNEPIEITWSLPQNFKQVSGDGMNGVWEITSEGRYQAMLRVADSRGNATDITLPEIQIMPASKVEGTLSVTSPYGEDKYFAPGKYVLSYRITSMPRGDKFKVNDILINDEKAGEFIGSTAVVDVQQPGLYNFTVRTHTTMGNYGDTTRVVEILPAPKPQCTIVKTENTLGTTYTANCTTDAGSIQKYEWVFNGGGQQQIVNSRSAYVRKAWYGTTGDLHLKVTTSLGVSENFSAPGPVPGATNAQ